MLLFLVGACFGAIIVVSIFLMLANRNIQDERRKTAEYWKESLMLAKDKNIILWHIEALLEGKRLDGERERLEGECNK